MKLYHNHTLRLECYALCLVSDLDSEAIGILIRITMTKLK